MNPANPFPDGPQPSAGEYADRHGVESSRQTAQTVIDTLAPESKAEVWQRRRDRMMEYVDGLIERLGRRG
jgi:hypothetical protein